MSVGSSVSSRPTSPVSAVPELVNPARLYRFTWDPATRKPGPASVSGTTEGHGGDYFNARPSLGFLNTSSANLPLDALPTEWSSSRHGFHAISTVLNNPHKRQQPPKAHSALPSIQPAELPRVRRKDFDSYLRAIAPEWERFERNAQLGREGQAQIDNGQWTPRSSLASDGSLIPPHRTAPLTPIPGRNIPPLDTVPSVFFTPNFNLGDPRTFNAVTEQEPGTEDLDDLADPISLSRSLPLMEKFSHYADTVEQHLVREISLRSTSFFAALTNLHDLQAESEQCLDRIGRMRTLLKDVDTNGAKKGLEMVRKECKMENIARVREGVRMVAGVVEMTSVAQGLVNARQWSEATDVIEEMGMLWQAEEQEQKTAHNGNGIDHGKLSPTPEDEEPQKEHKKSVLTPGIPLSSLHAFAALPVHLRTLTMEITSSLSAELVSILQNDLDMRINSGKDTKLDQGLRNHLEPLLLNLARTKGLKEGILSWREVILGEIRRAISKRLPEYDGNEEDSNASRAGLANHLRNLSQQEFMILLQAIYQNLLNAVEGLKAQEVVILELLETLKKSTSIEMPALEEDLSDILSSAAELSNTQAAKVVSYRAEQHAALGLPEFLVFFNDSWSFVVKCEVICRRMIVGLRGTVVGQAKVFLQQYHQAKLTISAKLVEDEQWNPSEVSPALQHIVDIIIDSAVRDSPELVINQSGESSSATSSSKASSNTFSLMAQSFSTQAMKTISNGSPASSGGAKHLRIDERTFFLVSATAEILVLIVDYLRIIVNLSMLTTDTMARVIEFLKAFNSRTCQVVLGAGAMRSAGLKNITAKHLALASQSLSIVFELIPYVREMFRRHLSQKQAVMLVEFDKLKRDYQEHQNEIHAKLIAIMGDRLSAHIKTLQGVDWHVPKPGGGINAYMEVLVKETVTLHKVLSRYLAVPIVEYVMTQVFAAINHRLSEEYGKIDLPNQEAKTRLLGDAKYLHQQLSSLKNVTAPTGMLETVIMEKSLPRAATTPTLTRSGTINGIGSSANVRLKSLLSGRSSTMDKALPTPARTPTPPIPSTEKTAPPTPSPSLTSSINGAPFLGTEPSVSGSSLEIAMSPPIQPEVAGAGGFREVPLPNSEPEAQVADGSLDSIPQGSEKSPPLTTLPPIEHASEGLATDSTE